MAIHFTKEEFTERKSKIIQELKKQDLDALLMFRQESMYWLTGYDTMGFVFFQCLILTTKGDVVLLTRAPDLRQAQNTSIIDDIRIWVDKDKSNPTNELKYILSELSLEKSNLGVEYEAYGLTGRNAINLNNSLKNYATLHDKSELISYFRAVKSPAEIVYVKKAAELADKALDEVWKIAKPGASESKILAEMQKVVFEGGGDYPANEYIVGSGHNALLCRYQSEKRILSNPDQLTIEWAGTFKHYHSAMMRTIPIGKANPKHFKMYEACLEALSNCEKKLKPGNKVGDVFDTHAETFENLGNRRYEWKCNNLNSASKNAAKRLGFKFEGVFRQMFVFKGKNRDTVWFAIIDKEWKKLKKGYLKFFKISNFDKNYKQIKKLRFE